MLTNPHAVQSAYLTRPRRNTGGGHWNGFRTHLMSIRRARRPYVPTRALASLGIWIAAIGMWQFLANPAQYNSQTNPGKTAQTNIIPGQAEDPVSPDPAALDAVSRAETLPDGPSGQLLPPGTMAPDRTYRNTYAWGNCTWYVAGRRQIPSGWGNAGSWYYHAISRGWATGAVPAVAAVAWTSAGRLGHVALVEQVSADGRSVYISEMNYAGLGRKSFRWASSSAFKYIY